MHALNAQYVTYFLSVFVKHGKAVMDILEGHAAAKTEVDIVVSGSFGVACIKDVISESFLPIYARLDRHDRIWR